MLCVASLMTLLSVSTANAQELSLRVEPGVAVPLTKPQSDRFKTGGAVALKPELGLGSYFSLGPSVSVVSFPSDVSGVDGPTAWLFGGFARLKRPHDEKNTGTGLTAVSPWVDGDAQYVRTGPLDRFGAAVAVGAAVPTSDSRNLWVGPFARYQLVNQEDGHAGFNTNNSKTLIVGLSFELSPGMKKKEEVPPVQPKKSPPPEPVKEEPKPVPPPVIVRSEEELELKQVVQFAWDSPVLDNAATHQLDGVIKTLTSSKEFKSIRVEGHASSEGQVKHNDALAQNRANSVMEFLASHGVPKEKLSAVGFGSRSPVATNDTEAGRVLNRRAEFVVKFVVVKESVK